jgi:hypothetical protein
MLPGGQGNQLGITAPRVMTGVHPALKLFMAVWNCGKLFLFPLLDSFLLRGPRFF